MTAASNVKAYDHYFEENGHDLKSIPHDIAAQPSSWHWDDGPYDTNYHAFPSWNNSEFTSGRSDHHSLLHGGHGPMTALDDFRHCSSTRMLAGHYPANYGLSPQDVMPYLPLETLSNGSSVSDYSQNIFDANFAESFTLHSSPRSSRYSPSLSSASASSSSPSPQRLDLSPESFTMDLAPTLPPTASKPTSSAARRRFPCSFCTKKMTSQYTLRVHLEAHKPKPRASFLCRMGGGCTESFSRQHDRLRHEVAKHDKVCEFTCDHCNRFFSSSKTLGNHKCPAQGGTRWVSG